MSSGNLLKQVGTDRFVEEEKPAPAQPKSVDEAATAMFFLALKALSQRALVAFSQLFTLLTCLSAFLLWKSVLQNPTVEQLVGVALYGLFILFLHVVRKKYDPQ